MELGDRLMQLALPEIESVEDFEHRMQECFESSFVHLDIRDAEEDQAQPVFGLNPTGTSSSIYSYTSWFYDGDESAFSPI